MTSGVSEPVVLQVESGVASITLAEPGRGCPMNVETLDQLAAAVTAAREADVRVVVLGTRGANFSVGGDLSAFAGSDDPGGYLARVVAPLHAVIEELQTMDAIVISVVRGVAAGAGFPLAAAADLVLAADDAKFTLAYTKVGLTPDGGTTLLTATLGLHRTMALALLNPVVPAQQALELGLVTAVHPAAELDAAVAQLVAMLCAGSRTAQVGAKKLVRAEAQPNRSEALAREAASMSAAADSADGREGVAAFVGKRKPLFTGA